MTFGSPFVRHAVALSLLGAAGFAVALAEDCAGGACPSASAAAFQDAQLQDDDPALLQLRAPWFPWDGQLTTREKCLDRIFPGCKILGRLITNCTTKVEDHLCPLLYADALSIIKIPSMPGKPSLSKLRDRLVDYYRWVDGSVVETVVVNLGSVVDCVPFAKQLSLFGKCAAQVQRAVAANKAAAAANKGHKEAAGRICPQDTVAQARYRLNIFCENRLHASGAAKHGSPSGPASAPRTNSTGSSLTDNPVNCDSWVPFTIASPGYSYSQTQTQKVDGSTAVGVTLGVGGFGPTPNPGTANPDSGYHILNQLWWVGLSVQHGYTITLEAGWIQSDYFTTNQEDITLFAYSTPDNYGSEEFKCVKDSDKYAETKNTYNHNGGFIGFDSSPVALAVKVPNNQVQYKFAYTQISDGYRLELTPFTMDSAAGPITMGETFLIGYWPNDHFCFEVQSFDRYHVGLEVNSATTEASVAGVIYGWGFESQGKFLDLLVEQQFCNVPSTAGYTMAYEQNPGGYLDRVSFHGSPSMNLS